MNTWKPFFFESNQFFDTIRGMEDWKRLRNAYPTFSDEDFLDAKEATWKGNLSEERRNAKPNYGFRMEHDGTKKLRDFFEENKMIIKNERENN
jgi:hypothetical protein